MSDVHRFTLGGIADTTLGIVLAPDHQDPMLPATRDRSVYVPGRNGRIEFEADLAERLIVLRCALVDASTTAALQAAIRAVSAVLLDDDGKPTDCALVFVKESTKTYTVRYAGRLPVQRLIGNTVGVFDLPLLAADPYAYGAEDTDSYSITAAYQTEAISNAGAFKTPVEITITNNGSDVTGFTLICRQLKS